MHFGFVSLWALSLPDKQSMCGESDEFRISPAASPEILHHTVSWRTRLFIAYSDERWLYYQFSLTSHIHFFFKKLYFFSLGVKGLIRFIILLSQILWVIPYDWLRWILVVIGMMLSGMYDLPDMYFQCKIWSSERFLGIGGKNVAHPPNHPTTPSLTNTCTHSLIHLLSHSWGGSQGA